MEISQFHDLVRSGDESGVRRAVAESPGLLAAVNHEGRSAIHVAMEDNTRLTEPLLEMGAPVDVVVAACLSRYDELTNMLADRPDLARDESTGLTVLGWASYYGEARSIAMLIDGGADPNDGSLFCAAAVASVDAGRALLDGGADCDRPVCDDGATALHVAATMLHTDCALPFVELLAARGADLRARTTVGNYSAREVLRRTVERERGTSRDTASRRRGFAELEAFLQEHAI